MTLLGPSPLSSPSSSPSSVSQQLFVCGFPPHAPGRPRNSALQLPPVLSQRSRTSSHHLNTPRNGPYLRSLCRRHRSRRILNRQRCARACSRAFTGTSTSTSTRAPAARCAAYDVQGRARLEGLLPTCLSSDVYDEPLRSYDCTTTHHPHRLDSTWTSGPDITTPGVAHPLFFLAPLPRISPPLLVLRPSTHAHSRNSFIGRFCDDCDTLALEI
jgi:hypothetical protein